MKKVIAILMVIFLFTVMFYGCGKGEVKDTTLSSVTTATTGTTENTTTPPVNTTVDHVKEYDEKEYMRQLDNLKYGEVPEYLKQIDVPSEEDVAFIREQVGDRYYLVSDPAQVWDKAFYESTYRCAYIGTFDIGDGESIVYFKGLSASGILPEMSPSFAYYKKSGKIKSVTPKELEEYEELLSLRESEYIDFVDWATQIIYIEEYDEKEYMRQLENLKYGEVPEYLKLIGKPSEEDLEAVREFYKYNFNVFITDPAQLWTDKSLIRYGGKRFVYLGTYDIENNESVLVFHVMLLSEMDYDVSRPDIVYYKNEGKVEYYPWLLSIPSSSSARPHPTFPTAVTMPSSVFSKSWRTSLISAFCSSIICGR